MQDMSVKEGASLVLVGTITFLISWIAFSLFSNKKKFPLFILTGYTGVILALMTDLLIYAYPLWLYPGTHVEQFFIQLLNGLGIYLVVIYLFLQSLPKKQTVLSMTRHILYWSLFAVILELFYLHIGFIEHGLWWNIGFSYVADWILFSFFYFHHKWISTYSIIK